MIVELVGLLMVLNFLSGFSAYSCWLLFLCKL